ncbi:pentatricopeptide repeat-containing protein [Striga asiatica]|uniref:Pentatricopeptide repeat-containing protein n=1 Tax=Striga asiatica TaxID=4170 RepID=A0A5A7QW63_STRAF|nr:pentatricopeptide repeat-containing protein [Striga asiatica]
MTAFSNWNSSSTRSKGVFTPTKCAEISRAHQLFAEMRPWIAVTWNAVISWYLKALESSTVFSLIVEIPREDIPMKAIRAVSAQLEDNRLGAQAHGLSLKWGLELNVVVGRSAIDMEGKFIPLFMCQTTLLVVYLDCGCSLAKLHRICSAVTKWDQITWNLSIAGFSNLAAAEVALACFSPARRVFDSEFCYLVLIYMQIGCSLPFVW